MNIAQDNATATCCCSVCGKKETPSKKLSRCSQCSSTSYLLCGKKCQRADWKRHKREECSVLRVEEGLPSDPCGCSLCEGCTEVEDVVSDFFNDLHMVRGCSKVYKFIHDATVTNVAVNGRPCNLKEVALTEDELDRIAYPFPLLVYKGHNYIDRTMTFYAPDGKAFTVRQLANAIAKAEKDNKDKHNTTGLFGGGWYFEGLQPHKEVKEPHTFASYWGTHMVSSRAGRGIFVVGSGFNPLITRMIALGLEEGEGGEEE